MTQISYTWPQKLSVRKNYSYMLVWYGTTRQKAIFTLLRTIILKWFKLIMSFTIIWERKSRVTEWRIRNGFSWSTVQMRRNPISNAKSSLENPFHYKLNVIQTDIFFLFDFMMVIQKDAGR